MKVKAILYKYHCANCENDFKSPVFSAYGSFLLRNKDNENLLFLNAISSKPFDEASNIYDSSKLVEKLSEDRRENLFHDVVMVAYDADEDGIDYEIGIDPHCPKCGKNKSSSYIETDPPEYIDMELPEAMSCKWDLFTDKEKIEKIENKILASIDGTKKPH
jgi:DNA-directed RNA polymerase subunit M/transcription elongation factor TFIIS